MHIFRGLIFTTRTLMRDLICNLIILFTMSDMWSSINSTILLTIHSIFWTQIHRLQSRPKMSSGCLLLCEIILSILLPPLGVCLRYGCCTVSWFGFAHQLFVKMSNRDIFPVAGWVLYCFGVDYSGLSSWHNLRPLCYPMCQSRSRSW